MLLSTLNLNELIESTSKMLARIIGEDIKIVTVPQPDLWTIQGDRGTLEQTIMNLAVNARDAMPRGGKLIIRTSNTCLDENSCAYSPERRPGKFVLLSVADTGVGMSKEVLQRIFEPFFTTKEPGKGTSLGLAVVYGVVKGHSGWIEVDSAPGVGTMPSFILLLEPGLNTDIPLPSDIVNDLAVMTYAIIID
jgi:signal transduction histidine kinase